MSTEPMQPSEPQDESPAQQQADLPPDAPDQGPQAESNDSGETKPDSGEKTPPRRSIKIGSQREGFRPIRQNAGIEEKWSDDRAPKAAPAPSVPETAPAPPDTAPPIAPELPAGPADPAPVAAPAPVAPTVTEQRPSSIHVELAGHVGPVGAPPVQEPVIPQADSPASPPRAQEGPPAAAQFEMPLLADDIGPSVIPANQPHGRIPRVSADLQAEIDAALDEVPLNDDSYDKLLMNVDAVAAEPDLELETRHDGTVVKIHEDNVFFALGVRHEGVASLRQFDEAPEVGAKLQVVAQRFNAADGLYEVSVPGASMKIEDWSDVAEGIVVEAVVTGHNTGGLECTVGHLRGFMPASQISDVRVEDFEEFKDQKLQCVVTEANPQRRNLVVSRRAMIDREREEAREKLWEELEVGQIREGVVRRLQDFGAFVDIGGVDGLIHISQLSWDRVNHPSEVLEEGQTVSVKIEKVDRETERIGLSYREAAENPWNDVEGKYPVHDNVKGTVSRLMEFGAFVKLEPGVEGLVHISEIAHHRVTRINHILNEGDEIEVKILSVDAESQRISLSLKQANPLPEPESKEDDDTPDGTRERAVARRTAPLKGGVDRPSGGEDIGLKW